MAEFRRARMRGHDIEVGDADGGVPVVIVDGEEVPVRMVGAKYAVAYIEPQDDLLAGAREYVRLLPPRSE